MLGLTPILENKYTKLPSLTPNPPTETGSMEIAKIRGTKIRK